MALDLISERGVLPHSLEAERSVLGAIILDNESIYQVLDTLAAEHFYAENHRILFERISELITTQRAVDLVLLKDVLSRTAELDQVGGISYIASL
ncbi:MAG TPA: DnaB-like helicase N-terminal domain-containing protein, partial [Acidobacteriota bacterium]|nr:DnaB-like helicase N-terminal domain-containing protein [Acidobacteriota bacterium]